MERLKEFSRSGVTIDAQREDKGKRSATVVIVKVPASGK